MLRPDLLQALRDLAPPFIRWPGGLLRFHIQVKERHRPARLAPDTTPTMVWGGLLGLLRLRDGGVMRSAGSSTPSPDRAAAPVPTPRKLQYAMTGSHYLNDPPTTEWGRLRASNGHPEPYGVRHFQVDNEPMNNGLTPEKYSEIVNVYGSRLRAIAPKARIVACGQKAVQ